MRFEIGGAELYSGSYCDRAACYGSASWGALLLGGDVDVGLTRPVALSIGVRELLAQGRYYNPNVLEPSIGVTFRFPHRGVVQPRLGLGIGILLGSDDVGNGAALRLGGGLSFFPSHPVGLALDLALEVGGFAGAAFTQVQLALGPEVHF